MNYKKSFAAIAIVAIATCAVLGIVFVVRNNLKTGIDLTVTSVSTEATTQLVSESQGDNPVIENDFSEEPEKEKEPITTETPTDIQIVIPSNIVDSLKFLLS